MTDQMQLSLVTITGADDSITPDDLVALTRRFPFVEWGILLSSTRQGWPRFPSRKWIDALSQKSGLKLSAHLCGRWVREVCAGRLTVFTDWPELSGMFGRWQFNFHAIVHSIGEPFWPMLSDPLWQSSAIIFQVDGVNDWISDRAISHGVIPAMLYDRSGGAGRLPDLWPLHSRRQIYCGYAGGLSPANVVFHLPKIAEAAGRSFWIDVETHVRSEDDERFDLDRVTGFLEAVEPFVMNALNREAK